MMLLRTVYENCLVGGYIDDRDTRTSTVRAEYVVLYVGASGGLCEHRDAVDLPRADDKEIRAQLWARAKEWTDTSVPKQPRSEELR
jgi:hypothetical protein